VVTLDLWSSPPPRLRGLRHVIVAGLRWVHEHGLSSGAGVVVAIIGVVVSILLWWMERRRPPGSEYERRVMLQRVRHRVECLLDRSLARAVWLHLGLAYRPDALPRDLVVRRPRRSAELVVPGTAIGELFDKVGGGLLILGAPGAGKTTLLLELARDLLDRAAAEPVIPIPVVFNLSSWALRRRPLADWLAAELVTRYDVPRRTAAA